MDVKKSRITYPQSVLKYYLKLFCKRSRSDKNKMLEGIQSWLTLSNSEKQQFFNKYKECRLNHKVKLANYLTKVQPYLKKRDITRCRTYRQIQSEETKLKTPERLNNGSEENISHLDNNEYGDARNCDESDEPNYNADLTFTSDQPKESTSLKSGPPIPVLAEPAPPSVRTGRELFEMLKANSADFHNESWTTLSSLQRSRYQRAIQLLKNDYIQKYKAYLESLPSKELFNCYNNFFD